MTEYLNESVLQTRVSSTRHELEQLYTMPQKKKKTLLAAGDLVVAAKTPVETHAPVKGAERVSLVPPAKTEGKNNYLNEFASALADVFREDALGVQSETRRQTDLQQLEQTMATIVMRTTNIAIQKEVKQANVYHEAKAYAEKKAEEDKILNWVTIGIAAILIVATIASSFFTGGATDAALPAELEMEGAAIGGVEGTAEGVADAAGEAMEEGAVSSGSGATDAMGQTAEMMGEGTGVDWAANTTELQELSNEAQVIEGAGEEGEGATEAATQTAKWGSRIRRLVISLALAVPGVMKGVTSIEMSGFQKRLAQAEANVGPALQAMTEMNYYNHFYQQLVQRGANLIQDQSGQLGDVIETYGSAMSGIRGISQNLAQAV